MWGLEVCEEVGEHRGLGDKTALSDSLFSVAGGLPDSSIIFTATSSCTLQEVKFVFLLINTTQSKCILEHFRPRLWE